MVSIKSADGINRATRSEKKDQSFLLLAVRSSNSNMHIVILDVSARLKNNIALFDLKKVFVYFL